MMPATYSYNDALEDAKAEIRSAWEGTGDNASAHMQLIFNVLVRLDKLKRPSRRKGRVRDTRPQLEDARGYVERAIASYVGDPADNPFQKGYLAALEVVRDEAFPTPSQKSAPAPLSSLPDNGESDPSVMLDCAGADTALSSQDGATND